MTEIEIQEKLAYYLRRLEEYRESLITCHNQAGSLAELVQKAMKAAESLANFAESGNAKVDRVAARFESLNCKLNLRFLTQQKNLFSGELFQNSYNSANELVSAIKLKMQNNEEETRELRYQIDTTEQRIAELKAQLTAMQGG